MYENGEIPLKLNSATYRDTITVPFGGAVVARIVADNPGKGLVTLNESEPSYFGYYRMSTITFDALNLTVQDPGTPPPDTRPYCTRPLSSSLPLDMKPHFQENLPLPHLTSDIWWPSLETCSNLFTSGHPRSLLTPGGYWSAYGHRKWAAPSHWNVFLLINISIRNGRSIIDVQQS